MIRPAHWDNHSNYNMEKGPQEEGSGGKNTSYPAPWLPQKVLVLFSGDNLPCIYSPKLGRFLSLTACSNLQTNVPVSGYLVKPSWSTHLDLPKFCFGASQQEGRTVFSQPSHWLLSFSDTHWGLGKINWSCPKIEETRSWNHTWSLPRNNDGGSKMCERYHIRKHCIVKKVQSDVFRTVWPIM